MRERERECTQSGGCRKRATDCLQIVDDAACQMCAARVGFVWLKCSSSKQASASIPTDVYGRVFSKKKKSYAIRDCVEHSAIEET